jgi:putative ABC transport system ATP-binding protein
VIRIRHLGKSYRRGDQDVTVLDNLSLDVERGAFLALMGPSGSGKSTLLNLIAGIDRPTKGSIEIDGLDIVHLSDARLAAWRAENVGFIFQFYNLIPVLTAYENVELPLQLTTVPPTERRQRVEKALEQVGLGDRMGHRPNELSGGQQQRVAIARALITNPSLIVADEPTGDLDRVSGEDVLKMLQQLNTEQGKTILMVTHDPKAASYAGAMVHLDKGQLESEPSAV